MKAFYLSFIALLVISCNSTTTTTTTSSSDNSTTKTISDTTKAREPTSVFKVTTLHTSDGGAEDDSSVSNYQYPSADTLPFAQSDFYNQLGSYGASYKLWPGPAGWTGNGVVGGDGNVLVHLFPIGGDSLTGPFIAYYEVPACNECMLEAAGHYFPAARIDYDSNFNQDHSYDIKNPEGMKVSPISAEVITYTIPLKNGLLTKGAAYYGTSGGDPYYKEIKVVLPEQQAAIANYLVNTFVTRVNVKQD